jgi:elongation factor P--(R)-beta-lysine ligase
MTISKEGIPATWEPTTSLTTLHLRATVLKQLRDFFAKYSILEVETPLLASAPTSDPFLYSMTTDYIPIGDKTGIPLYMQTSPEYAMKRLLCSGSGSIYQICKAFRNGESGRWHNPEFTMLEWYELGTDHHGLMDRMDELLQIILMIPPATRLTYQAVFQRYLQLDPFEASVYDLQQYAKDSGIQCNSSVDRDDKDTWLQMLMSDLIEPQLGMDGATFVYDFPSSQAALARINPATPEVAARFEVYIQGIELANGFYELNDAHEQYLRFCRDLEKRQRLGLEIVPIDYRLLAALQQGLPECAGVAVGVDRLIMLAAKAEQLAEVISFPLARV